MSSYTQPQSSVTETNTSRSEATNNSSWNAPVTGNGSGGDFGEFGDETAGQHASQGGLPEQKHAGNVGYGPDYAKKNRATLGEKVTGIKEQVVGKLTNNPELVQKGHDRKTGELSRIEQEENESDPFATEDKQDSPLGTTTRSAVRTAPNVDVTNGTRGYTGSYGDSSTNGFTAAGESRSTTDPYPSYGVSHKENVAQPDEL